MSIGHTHLPLTCLQPTLRFIESSYDLSPALAARRSLDSSVTTWSFTASLVIRLSSSGCRRSRRPPPAGRFISSRLRFGVLLSGARRGFLPRYDAGRFDDPLRLVPLSCKNRSMCLVARRRLSIASTIADSFGACLRRLRSL